MPKGTRAVVFGLLGIMFTAPACGGPPDPAFSTVPDFIRVGGKRSMTGLPDPTLPFTVTVMDNVPAVLPGEIVEFDFTGCFDTRLCTAVVAGQTVDCINKKITATTNTFGQVTVSILGANTVSGTIVPPSIAPGAGAGCVTIRAGSPLVVLGSATAVTYDLNGALSGFGNGVTALDLALAKLDIEANALAGIMNGTCGAGALYRGRTDYNLDGALSTADLAALKTIIGNSALGNGSGAGCASGGSAQPYCP